MRTLRRQLAVKLEVCGQECQIESKKMLNVFCFVLFCSFCVTVSYVEELFSFTDYSLEFHLIFLFHRKSNVAFKFYNVFFIVMFFFLPSVD